MKFRFNLKYLPAVPIICGGLGALLRLLLYKTGMDREQLLIPMHPAGILALVLSLAVAAGLILITWGQARKGRFQDCFPASPLGGIGCFLGGAAIFLGAMTELVRRATPMAAATGILGLIAAAALVFTGLCRIRGRRPGFIFHLVICLFFMIRLIDRYQVWSADPQLEDYCFQLLATVASMLFSYHMAEIDLGPGRPRRLALISMLGSYFCLLSVVRTDSFLIYLGTAVWMLTNPGTPESLSVPAEQEEDA